MSEGVTSGSIGPGSVAMSALLEKMDAGVAHCRVEYDGERAVDMVFLYTNPAFRRQTGLAPRAGQRATDLAPAVGDTDPWLLETWGRVARTGVGERFERRIAAVGQWYEVELISPCRGELIALFDVVTSRREDLDRIESERRRTASILKAAADGIHILDREGWLVEANDKFLAMLGYDATAIGLLHVSDWDAADKWNALRGEYEGLIDERRSAMIETRHRRADGTLYDAEVNSTGIEVGGTGYLYASVRDVTSRREAEAALQAAAQRLKNERALLRTLLEAIPDPVWMKDLDGVYLACNRAFEKLFGAREADIVGKTDYDIVPREVADFFRQKDRDALAAGHALVNEEWVQFGPERRRILFETTKLPIRGEDGRYTGVIGIGHDITERHRQTQLIEDMALHDPLTRLANRRLLVDRMEQVLAACRRKKCVGSLMIVDLDNFKMLNDVHGHAIGDLLLIEVAIRLKRCVRDMDTVARLGGDEFVVLVGELPETGGGYGAAALAIAERIRATLAEPYRLSADWRDRPEAARGVPHRASASIGVTLIDDGDRLTDDLLRDADMAMYRAKVGGRDRVCLFQQEAR